MFSMLINCEGLILLKWLNVKMGTGTYMLLVIHDMPSDCAKWMIDTIKIFQVNILPHGRFKWSSVIKSIWNELSSIDQKDGLNEKDAMSL